MGLTLFSTWRRALSTIVVVIAAVGAVVAIVAARSDDTAGHPVTAASDPTARPGPTATPVRAGSDYLALGDSVTFGYREPTSMPKPDYEDAGTFVGYPEDVASALSLHVANASCPGETSASLINSAARDNGCETDPAGNSVGYRVSYPLHVSYTGSQLAYAVRYLERHHGTRLVSLMIGANDAFRCQADTNDNCVSEFPALLARVGVDVRTILRTVRAHYTGQIVIVNYYSTDYAEAARNALSQSMNQAVDNAATPFGARIADGYGAFERAAARAGGDACKAGLLTRLSSGGCGVHPSAAGQKLLAGAVERAIIR